MNELFKRLEVESSKQFNLSTLVPDIIPGRDPFQGQTHHNDKVIQKEKIFVCGREVTIRRVFLRVNDSYRSIGWVLYKDIHQCMICSKTFPRVVGKKKKNHCRVCGNIVCRECLNGRVKVKEFNMEFVDACANCFWGQDEISLSNNDEPNPVSTNSREPRINGENPPSSAEEECGSESGSGESSDGNSEYDSGEEEDDKEEDGEDAEGAEGYAGNRMHLMSLLLTLAVTNPCANGMSMEQATEYVQARDDEYLEALAREREQQHEGEKDIDVTAAAQPTEGVAETRFPQETNVPEGYVSSHII